MFTPTFEEVELSLLETYDTVLRGASEIPRYSQTYQLRRDMFIRPKPDDRINKNHMTKNIRP